MLVQGFCLQEKSPAIIALPEALCKAQMVARSPGNKTPPDVVDPAPTLPTLVVC